MPNHLREYVRSSNEQGYPKQEIRQALARAGYSQERIAEVIGEADHHWMKRSLLLIIAIFLVVGVVYFLLPGFEKIRSPLVSSVIESCPDIACFTLRANDCLPTIYKSTEVGSEVTYKIQECVLTKELTKFSDAEPVTVRNFFTGKTMRCAYERNHFDRASAQNLLGGLERCDGSLKEAIVQLQST